MTNILHEHGCSDCIIYFKNYLYFCFFIVYNLFLLMKICYVPYLINQITDSITINIFFYTLTCNSANMFL